MNSDVAKGVLLMVLACGLLTANDALMKSLVASLPLGQVIAIRGISALVVLLALAPLFGGYSKFSANRKRSVLVCSGLLVINITLFPFSFSHMPLANAIILAYTSPIWVVAFAPVFLSEKVRWQQWVAVLMGFAGACLVIKPGSSHFTWAVFIPLTVAFIVGVRDMVTRKIARSETALSIVLYTNVLTIAVGLLTAPFGWEQIDFSQGLQLVFAGIFFSTSQLMMVEAFRMVEATVLSTFKYSSILFAALFGYLFWGERLDSVAIVGACLIVASGLAIVRYRQKPLATGSEVLPRNARTKD
ncbi:MAG: DMT family transporter [Pseudomonadota bacterium]